jgi:hypothetical protein
MSDEKTPYVQLTASQISMQILGVGKVERQDEVTDILTMLYDCREDRETDPDTWMAGFLAVFNIIAANFPHALSPEIDAVMQDLTEKELAMSPVETAADEQPAQPAQ